METTEIIAELRRLLEVGDSPVFCGGTFISKQLAKEAADRLEYLDGLMNELEAVVHGQTSGDLIRLSDLMKFPIRIDHYDKVNGNEHFVYGVESVLEYAEYLPRVEAESVVRCGDCARWYRHTEVDLERGDCRRYNVTKHESGYCDRGERRTDV